MVEGGRAKSGKGTEGGQIGKTLKILIADF